jgi:hypothetical protein
MKREIPIDKADLVLARKNAGNKNPSLEMDADGNIIPRNSRNPNGLSDYTVMVRKANNSGNLPEGAKSLKACKGLKGCEFATCAQEVFGRLPARLQKLKDKCSIDG